MRNRATGASAHFKGDEHAVRIPKTGSHANLPRVGVPRVRPSLAPNAIEREISQGANNV